MRSTSTLPPFGIVYTHVLYFFIDSYLGTVVQFYLRNFDLAIIFFNSVRWDFTLRYILRVCTKGMKQRVG